MAARSDALPVLAVLPLADCDGRDTVGGNFAPATESTEDLLGAWDLLYDAKECLLREVSPGSAYHSQVRKGQIVHPLRTSAFYAHGLLQRGDTASIDRATAILDRLVGLQISDPLSPYFGIWSYFLEEKVEQMAPADFNWADFISARFLEILKGHREKLPEGLGERLESSVRYAVLSIFRRNVEVSYTNIAIMGATVASLSGEMFQEPVWLMYGRNRIQAVRALYERNGGFGEYNSPTYSLTALFELERILRHVNDPPTREAATVLWRAVWEDLAQSYHPSTGQLSGPQSRSYSDWLSEGQLRCMEQRLRISLVRKHPKATPKSMLEELIVPGSIPCPADLVERFKELPGSPLFRRQCRVRNEAGEPIQTSSCWMSHQATIGSISQEIAWFQTRPVLAYWTCGLGEIARCRVRVLLNGRDFASGLLLSEQNGSTVLTGCQFISDGGTYHPHFDKPAGGIFRINDLRLRVEIEGRGLRLKRQDERSLWIGNQFGGLSLRFGEAAFDGSQSGALESARTGETYLLDLILHHGAERAFEPANAADTFAALVLRWAPQPATKPLPPLVNLVAAASQTIVWREDGESLGLQFGRFPGPRNSVLKPESA